MFLASLLGLLGMAAHESYTTSPEYLNKKYPKMAEQQRMRMAMLDQMEKEQRARAKELREYNNSKK